MQNKKICMRLVFALLLVAALVSPAAAAISVEESFYVGEASGMAVADDGTVWFTQRVGLNLGHLDPATGEVTLYPIPYQTGARYGGGGNPQPIMVHSAGDVWFSEIPMNDGGGEARIARFHPDTETFEEYVITPDWWNGYGGSISISAYGLDEGPDGRVWFHDRQSNGYGHTPHIGTIDPATGAMTIYQAFPVDGFGRGTSNDIAVTADGRVYYSNRPYFADTIVPPGIVRFDEATGISTDIAIDKAFDLHVDNNDDVWFIYDYLTLGKVNKDDSIELLSLASATGELNGYYLGHDSKNILWYPARVNYGSYQSVGRIDPATNAFSAFTTTQNLGNISDLKVDNQDRIWIATFDSIIMVDVDNDNDGVPNSLDCNDSDPELALQAGCTLLPLTIVVNKAQYFANSDKLRVEAFSDYAADAALEVLGYGPMTWDVDALKWVYNLKDIGGNPGTVTVAGPEGAVDVVVEVK